VYWRPIDVFSIKFTINLCAIGLDESIRCQGIKRNSTAKQHIWTINELSIWCYKEYNIYISIHKTADIAAIMPKK
jgi:hypothetical protein